MLGRISRRLGDLAASGRAGAEACILGFLPVALVNAWFATQTATTLSASQRAWYHAYDAGQIIALGAALGLVALALGALPLRPHRVVAALLAAVGCYVVLGGDLANFIARHADSRVPFRPLFALAGAGMLTVSALLGAWLSKTRVAPLTVAAGIGLAVGNHLVLELDYPGAHLIIALGAAAIAGPTLRVAAARVMSNRTRAIALPALALISVPALLVPAGPIVRTALLGTSGAVAAPFVTRWWSTRTPQPTTVAAAHEHPEWWKPRTGLPAIAPQPFEGKPAEPIVVLLTLDAVRGDLIETKRWAKYLPNLKRLRKQSLRFKRAWSPAPATRPSVAAFFLGTYVSQQRWVFEKHKQPMPAPDQGPYLAALLERHGVKTVNVASHGALRASSGIAHGFGEEINLVSRAPSEEVVFTILERLGKHSTGPLFLWAHNMDAHAPYDRGGNSGSQRRRYLAEIELVDSAVGALLTGIENLGLTNRLYLIVSADHGEAFGEHGHRFHARSVYEEMIRVPFYIQGPNVKAREIDQTASGIDLPPTILDLFGVPTPGHFMGQSVVPLIAGRKMRFARPLAIDSTSRDHARGMLFDEHIKAIEQVKSGTEEVYDLDADPAEKNNLAETPEGQRHIATLREFFRIHAPDSADGVNSEAMDNIE